MTDEQNNKPKGVFIPFGKQPAGNDPQQTTAPAAEPVKGTLNHATQKPAQAVEPIKGTPEHANQATPLPTPTVKPKQIKPTVAPADEPTRTTAFDESIRQIQAEIDRRKPETEEERKKRERMERSKKVIGAVSDGLRALSNVFFTAKGAPSMYDPNSSLLSQTDKRIKEAAAQRDAGNKERLAMLERLGNMKLARDKFNMNAEELKQRMKLANEKAQRDADTFDWEKSLREDKGRKQKGEADAAEATAITEKTNAGYADAINKEKLANEKKRGQVYNSQVGKNNAQAAAAGRSNSKEFVAYDEEGNAHYFSSGDAAESFARQRGTWQDQSRTLTETDTDKKTDRRGKTETTTKTATRKVVVPGYPKIVQKPKQKANRNEPYAGLN